MNIKVIRGLAVAAVLSAWSSCFASDQYGSFARYADRASLKPFARDLGGVLGSASFHSGRSLGFSGFDVGIHGGMQFKPSKNDLILRSASVGVFGLPWVQAEIGLPFRLDGYIRDISYQGLTIAGGGLRYSLLKVSDVRWKPQALLSAVAHSVTHKDFSGSHVGLNLVVSWGVPLITPYVGVGVDRTRVVVRSANIATVDPTIVGAETTTTESRFTAGITVKPYPVTYIQVALTLAHGQPGAEMGLGIRY